MKTEEPLVSIVVITYNSSKYVLETLESAKVQTYKNVELIISDDGSTDETIEICQEWLDTNKNNFVNSELISVEKNTGIPANCNRGIKASQGEWIKLIAGDDILLKDCISTNIKYAIISNHALYFSNVEVFNNDSILTESTSNYNKVAKWFGFKKKRAKIKCYNRYPIMLNVPTFFIKRNVIIELGYYDERFKLLEDQPFLLKMLNSNYDIEHINKTTVRYRFHETSTMNSSSELFIDDLFKSYRLFSRPNLNNNNLRDLMFKFYRDLSFYIIRKNKTNFATRYFLRFKNIIYKLS